MESETLQYSEFIRIKGLVLVLLLNKHYLMSFIQGAVIILSDFLFTAEFVTALQQF